VAINKRVGEKLIKTVLVEKEEGDGVLLSAVLEKKVSEAKNIIKNLSVIETLEDQKETLKPSDQKTAQALQKKIEKIKSSLAIALPKPAVKKAEKTAEAIKEQVKETIVKPVEKIVPKIINTAPVLTAPTIQKFYSINDKISLKIKARDKEKNPLIFSLKGAPRGMSISPFDGAIFWKPKKTGEYKFKVKVTDSDGLPAFLDMVLLISEPIFGALRIDKRKGVEGKTPFKFDVSDSRITVESDAKIKFLFDFEGDGKWDFPETGKPSLQSVVTHVYPKAGKYKPGFFPCLWL